jgi:hypothetical protein
MTELPPLEYPEPVPIPTTPPLSPYILTPGNNCAYAKYDPADGFLISFGTVAQAFFDDWVADGEPVVVAPEGVMLTLEGHIYDLATHEIREMTPEEVQARRDKYTTPEARSLMSAMIKPTTMNDVIIALDEKEHGDPSKWQELLAQARNTTNGQSP